MITKFDKASLGRVRHEVNGSLAELGERLGITLHLGNISYKDNTFTAKVEGCLAGFDARSADWSDYCWKFGLKEDWLGQTFAHGGEEYKIVGLNRRARKNPVIVELRGKTYTISASLIRNSFSEEVTG